MNGWTEGRNNIVLPAPFLRFLIHRQDAKGAKKANHKDAKTQRFFSAFSIQN
jgi:hypothetical protein